MSDSETSNAFAQDREHRRAAKRKAARDAVNARYKRWRLLGQYLDQLIKEGKFPDPGPLKVESRRVINVVRPVIATH